MPSIEANFLTVCTALARLQTALVDESTERGPISPRLDAALKASWAQWTPSDEDPTVNLKAADSLVLPTIHLNGSSPERLRDDYLAARSAVYEAFRKLGSVDVNGRDYYPQGPEAYPKAQAQLTSQLSRLNSVADELLTLADHCDQHVRR